MHTFFLTFLICMVATLAIDGTGKRRALQLAICLAYITLSIGYR